MIFFPYIPDAIKSSRFHGTFSHSLVSWVSNLISLRNSPWIFHFFISFYRGQLYIESKESQKWSVMSAISPIKSMMSNKPKESSLKISIKSVLSVDQSTGIFCHLSTLQESGKCVWKSRTIPNRRMFWPSEQEPLLLYLMEACLIQRVVALCPLWIGLLCNWNFTQESMLSHSWFVNKRTLKDFSEIWQQVTVQSYILTISKFPSFPKTSFLLNNNNWLNILNLKLQTHLGQLL